LTTPEGTTLEISNLRSFCRENGLDQGNMLRNHVKGWTCSKVI